MESYYKSGIITFMLAEASEYAWMTRNCVQVGASTIFKDLVLRENSI